MSGLRTKLLDGALVVAYMALAALPVIAMTFGLRGRALFGVLTPIQRPELELASVLSERYQHDLAAWFESNLGLKGTSIAADNTILYHAFRETKPGSTVRIGRDGVLLPADDVEYYNAYGAALPSRAFFGKLAAQIAHAQELLAARGQAFVPVIVPGKASIWRDKVPASWTRDLGEPRPSDTLVYQRLVDALDLFGVRYVDVREKFATSREPRALLFGADSRHWSDYGACLAMDDVATLYAELTGKPRPAHAGELEMIPASLWAYDFDLLRLLNAMFVAPAVQTIPSVRHSPAPPLAPCPSILFVGTSFCETLMHEADASGLYGAVHLNSYNAHFETWPGGERIPLDPKTDVWREITLGKDLYVLELFEVYLKEDAHIEQFLRDFLPELERTRD